VCVIPWHTHLQDALDDARSVGAQCDVSLPPQDQNKGKVFGAVPQEGTANEHAAGEGG